MCFQAKMVAMLLTHSPWHLRKAPGELCHATGSTVSFWLLCKVDEMCNAHLDDGSSLWKEILNLFQPPRADRWCDRIISDQRVMQMMDCIYPAARADEDEVDA